MAGAANAQDNDAPNGQIRTERPPPTPPAGARQQAEAAVRQGLSDPAGARFRSEAVRQASSVQHGVFDAAIQGPVSVVCGQYKGADATAGYAWFYVAIKQGQVLWADVDKAADATGAAHNACKAAGMAS
jgi:hypothetical protein